MKVVLLDTLTGEKQLADNPDLTSWQWYNGNWSCDCNRQSYFGVDDSVPIPGKGGRHCLGGKRFIITDAEVNNEDDWTSLSLFELNEDYPVDLLQAHGVDPTVIITEDHKLTPP